MYKLELTREELSLHVNGLDAQVRLIAQQIMNAQSAGFALKNALTQLVNIDMQFDKLSKIMQDTDASSEGNSPLTNGTKEAQSAAT